MLPEAQERKTSHGFYLDFPMETWLEATQRRESIAMTMRAYILNLVEADLNKHRDPGGKILANQQPDPNVPILADEDALQLSVNIGSLRDRLGKKYELLVWIQTESKGIPSELRQPGSFEEVAKLKEVIFAFLIQNKGGIFWREKGEGKFIPLTKEDVELYCNRLQMLVKRSLILHDQAGMNSIPEERREIVRKARDLYVTKLKPASQISTPAAQKEADLAAEQIAKLLQQFGDTDYENKIKAQLTEALRVQMKRDT